MSKKFHPKDSMIQELVSWFEASLKNQTGEFFPEEDLEQLVEYYESLPDYEKAFMVVNRGIELFPYSGSFLVKKAQLYYHTKNYSQAWLALEQASIFEALSPELLLLEVDLLNAEGNFQESIEKLNVLMGVVSEDERMDVLLEIADVYDMANQPIKLYQTLQTILRHTPLNEEALHRFCNFVIDEEYIDQGILFLNEIIAKKPYNFLAWYYLAKCYQEVGLLEKAVDAYEYSLAINEHYFTHWDYCFCLQLLALWDKAILAYHDMLELFEDDTAVHIQIAYCERQKHNFANAIKHYVLAKENTNNKHKKANCEFLIGKVYEESGDMISSLSHFKKAITLRPSKPKFWNSLGRLYLKLNRIEDAINCFIHSLAEKEYQPKQWMRLAACYYQLGANDLLFDTLHQANLLLPNHIKLSYQYAGYLLTNGFVQSGLLQLEHALSLDSSKKKHIFALFPELEHRQEVIQLCEQF